MSTPEQRLQDLGRLFNAGTLSATELGYLETLGWDAIYVGALIALGATPFEAEQELLRYKHDGDDMDMEGPFQEELPFHLGDDDDQC